MVQRSKGSNLGFNNFKRWKRVTEICAIPSQQPPPVGGKCADKNVRHGTPETLALPIEGDVAFPGLMRVLPIPPDEYRPSTRWSAEHA